ncbi:Glyoxylase, beta-lactamase superfamily II [Geodermatophilus amargosae]|uniref:Glyoxylase, beta-lactamase superfamily II n=1 Tax=Geodermatophilus amargosae TaxID=1296565 RepID=A0A1I6X5R6_9ACTN|nr:MBL fold metallo-hydrolase [Geodermatophilus amargosae]SFT33553.1 Glyoxylase, beta-lactamase superfamily II [Geodermatophilus amargosae]
MPARSDDVRYGGVTLLSSPENGRYPCGNSLLVSGSEATALVDPSIEVGRRGREVGPVDLAVVSHAHEDHVAGLHGFPEVPAHVHPAEAAAVRDPEVLVAGFGMDEAAAGAFGVELRTAFGVTGHEAVRPMEDGDVLDLGGRTMTVVHLPGHTAGHCGLLVEPDGFLFVGDIDLTGFGPYYGDVGSDLDALEASFGRLRDVEARWYGTAHHRGVVEGRAAFLAALDTFAAVVTRRDETLLGLLERPRTLAEIVDHRLVYRPHVALPFVAAVERRTAEQHLARLQRAGAVRAEGDTWLRA